MNKKVFLLFAVFLLVLAAGCLGGPKESLKVSQFDSELKTSPSPSIAGNADESERKVISTASLTIEVENVQNAFNDITNITMENGGFISSSSINNLGYDRGARRNGYITARVPQKNFYTAIGLIESLGTVRSKQISGQDVTEEFVDLGARLGNLKKQESRLQDILKNATTVKDVLDVERELERVRGEIERLTGRLNYLNNSVEMSTITVNTNEPAPITGEGWGITESSREAVTGFIASVNGIIIFVGYMLPVLVFIILVYVIALRVKRKILPKLK